MKANMPFSNESCRPVSLLPYLEATVNPDHCGDLKELKPACDIWKRSIETELDGLLGSCLPGYATKLKPKPYALRMLGEVMYRITSRKLFRQPVLELILVNFSQATVSAYRESTEIPSTSSKPMY
jgi:hypothetical protein